MLDDKMMRMLNQEISTMEAIHHPNLIRLYEVVETYSKLYLVMEYAGGGELYNKVTTMGKLEEAVARNLFSQICSAVSHMVNNSIWILAILLLLLKYGHPVFQQHISIFLHVYHLILPYHDMVLKEPWPHSQNVLKFIFK